MSLNPSEWFSKHGLRTLGVSVIWELGEGYIENLPPTSERVIAQSPGKGTRRPAEWVRGQILEPGCFSVDSSSSPKC